MANGLKVSGKTHTRTKAEAFMRCKVGKDGIFYIMSTVYKPGRTEQKWHSIGKLSSEQTSALDHYDELSESYGIEVLNKYRK